MNYFIKNENDSSPIRQGDIFKVGNDCYDVFMEEEVLAMVITADCDIAQNKMGNSFTLLPIITLEHYLETKWLPALFEIELNTIVKNNVAKFNSANKTEELNCDPLDLPSMKDWLTTDTLEEIFTDMKIRVDKKVTDDSKKIEVLKKTPNFKNFHELRKKLQSKADDKIKSEIHGAITQLRGEFLFIPELPCFKGLGGIVKLREVRAINQKLAFPSNFEARLSEEAQERGIVRVGKFTDFLRYSISQQFAILFSRIGMPENFESDVSESLAILSNSMIETYNEN